jgi:cobalt-zinc-cadmium efflux system membrane fusion protein
MFATVSFFLEESAETIDIPATAVLTESGSSFVYLARDETTFIRQKIDVQPDGPGRMRLLAGLRVGDHIVTDGAILVRAEEEKKGDN